MPIDAGHAAGAHSSECSRSIGVASFQRIRGNHGFPVI
jgi:hypothetical protein